MSDVFLFQTIDNGNVNLTDEGDLELTAGLETAVYVCLFGGNEDDDGSGSREQWWGNSITANADEHMVSRFQYLLRSLPAVSANLKRLNDAGLRDLEFISSMGYDVEITTTIPARNRVSATVSVSGRTFEFQEDWAIS